MVSSKAVRDVCEIVLLLRGDLPVIDVRVLRKLHVITAE